MRVSLDKLAYFFVSPPGFLITLVLVFFVALGWPYGGSAADWASAAGTTAAVFAAIWLADRQRELEEQRQVRMEYEATFGTFKIAVFCVSAAKRAALNLAEGKVSGVAAPRHVSHLNAALEDMRLVGVPKDGAMQDAYFDCKRCVVDAIALFQAEVESPGKYRLEAIAMKLAERCDRAIQEVEDAMTAYSIVANDRVDGLH